MHNKSKILIVDDEQDILEFLKYNLKKENLEVFTANNGIDGLEIAKKHAIDLIILDVMMPKMDGIEVCEQIRSTEKLNQILVLFLTARSEEYSELAGFSAGADDYVTKPIKPKLLISRVKALLKRKRNSDIPSRIKIGDIEIDKEQHKNNREDTKSTFIRNIFFFFNSIFFYPFVIVRSFFWIISPLFSSIYSNFAHVWTRCTCHFHSLKDSFILT